jgi:hypothetical protein
MKTAKSKTDTAPRLLTNGSNAELTPERIALAAYYIWEQEKRPGGREVEHWLRAESLLQKASNPERMQA